MFIFKYFLILTLSLFYSCSNTEKKSRCLYPLLMGHRGTNLFAPENTLSAFRYALEHGADGLEIDVQLTKDNLLVAFHDSTTERTTNDSQSHKISELTLAEIQTLDAGSWFSDDFENEIIPTAYEILELAKDTNSLFLFDLKGIGSNIAVAEFIKQNGIEQRSIVSSFDKDVLEEFYELMPEIDIMFYLSNLNNMYLAKDFNAKYIRAPKSIENLAVVWDAINEDGFLAAVSGSYISYEVSMGLVNNMGKTYTRRKDRKPSSCN